MTGWALVAAGLLLLANGAFVAVEFALLAARRPNIERLAAEGSRRARAAASAMGDLSDQLAGAQLGITMASLGLGFVAEPAVGHLIEVALEPIELPSGVSHTVSFVVALSLVVFVHMVIGEMVPKNMAIADPERTVLWIAVPWRGYMVLTRPVVRALNGVANVGLRLLGVAPQASLSSAHTAEELSAMLAASRSEGAIADFEHDLLSGALDFGEREAASVMVPRDEVVSVSRRAPVGEVEAIVVDTGRTRLPVTDAGIDDIVGFVHAKDLLPLPPEAQAGPVPVQLIRQMLVVPTDRSIEDLLRAMRRSRSHVALVTRPDGATAGIVTLEDVVEALVGKIRDESDRP